MVKNSIVNRIKLYVIEKYGDNYYIVSDSDVALMNKKVAELQMQGCDSEVCMKQIGDAIDADEIIYGDILREGEKIKFQFTNINRDKSTFVMTTKSIVDISFFERHYDHFVKEATTKLIEPKYRINLNVEIKSDDTISLKTINLGKIDSLDLSVLDFQSNDSVISNILEYLKEELKNGDNRFTNKQYEEAREIYERVLQRIHNKLTKEKRVQIKNFEDSVLDRIGSSYVMVFKEKKIEIYDKILIQMKNPKEEDLKEILKGYTDIEAELDRVPKVYSKRVRYLKKGLGDRKESLAIALIGLLERKGDAYYTENRFEEAFKSYHDGKEMTKNLRDGKNKETELKMENKLETTKKTGGNYVRNMVKTYLDQAEYLNLQDKLSDAIKSLEIAKKTMDESQFTPYICLEWYRETAELLGVIKTFKNSIGMKFVLIPAGSFEMGCPEEDQDCLGEEKPRHTVTITKAFYMGKYEVTQGQWKAIMGTNPSFFKNCGDTCPVERVSWDDVQEFIHKLNAKEGGNKYRLPTEAEWEYAARAGSKNRIYTRIMTIKGKHNSPELDMIGWYGGNSGVNYEGGVICFDWEDKQKTSQNCGTHPVGKKKPNQFGLYDMVGNVSEWTVDYYRNEFYPKNSELGLDRILKGSAWLNYAKDCRLSRRLISIPTGRFSFFGFRLLLEP